MASIPKQMRGILVEKTGGVDVLQYKTDMPVPTLAEGEVLVKNEFIGVNYIDTYFRTGLYQSSKPEILGRECVGWGRGALVLPVSEAAWCQNDRNGKHAREDRFSEEEWSGVHDQL